MEPTRDTQATLVDLLDRVLDKGLILDADIIIHIAGIPLLGVKLKAALAGMETMLRYGIWQDWDEAQRAVATEEERQKKRLPLAQGEEVLLKTFAYIITGGQGSSMLPIEGCSCSGRNRRRYCFSVLTKK